MCQTFGECLSWLCWHVISPQHKRETIPFIFIYFNKIQSCATYLEAVLSFYCQVPETYLGQLQVAQGLHFWNGFGELSVLASKTYAKACPILVRSLEALESRQQANPLVQLLEATQEHTPSSHGLLCLRKSHKNWAYLREYLLLVCYPECHGVSPLILMS